MPRFCSIFSQLLQLFPRTEFQKAVARSKPFRFKNTLVSLDATVIDLCAEMFAWAAFRRTKGPTTIARIYKDRWQIELLFKALKQNLRVTTFVGTSANALHIQIWTAVIALLILKYLQPKATFGWSLSNMPS